ncbi:MAG: hypothetical protein FJY91_01865 [Candidatus Harrisonbacteria bacterium]|nr:hypothetical protein [Candidatus Harrisonbacteria bacterium]
MLQRAYSTQSRRLRSSKARKPKFIFALFHRRTKKKPWEKIPREVTASHLHEAIVAFVEIPEGNHLRKHQPVSRNENGKITSFHPETTHLKVDLVESYS